MTTANDIKIGEENGQSVILNNGELSTNRSFGLKTVDEAVGA